VGVLVSYTWRRGGEVFPVREGRNYIGSAEDCEISIPSDPQMSSRHATIVFRGRDFWVDDEKSMNGTFVEEKRPLADRAQLKAGATLFTFVALVPPQPVA
jgi:pSer/pThr/pTyr-binding forkhead associated (FHA) protein